MKSKKEFCIMPKNSKYSTERFLGSHRHEVFFGKNRQRSIKDGLVVFITYEQHEGTYGVHGKNGNTINRLLKMIAQRAWQDYYNKTEDDFIKEYGRNYL